MALVTTSIPNLVGGVSQQPDSVRFVNQSEAQENAVPSVLTGLSKRPPTNHLSVLKDTSNNAIIPTNAGGYKSHVHAINRDVNERFIVTVTHELNCHGYSDNKYRAVVRVNDINGVAQTVKWDTTSYAAYNDWMYAYLSPFDEPAVTEYTTAPSTQTSPGADEPDLEFITVADVTLILNKKVKPRKHRFTPSTESTTSTELGPPIDSDQIGVIHVKRFELGVKYEFKATSSYVHSDGTRDWGPVEFSYTTGNTIGSSGESNTSYVATQLAAAFNASTGLFDGYNGSSAKTTDTANGFSTPKTGLFALAVGSTVFFYRRATDADDGKVYPTNNPYLNFELSCDDGMGGTLMKCYTDEATFFSDLSDIGLHGHNGSGVPDSENSDRPFNSEDYHGGQRVRIAGNPSANSDDYFVEFIPENVAYASNYTWLYQGRWKEGTANNTNWGIWSEYGMPLLLIRQSDGTWLVKTANGRTPTAVSAGGQRPNADDADVYDKYLWKLRRVGDEEINPDPSFVEKRINGMTFYNNRLIMLSDESVIMSEAGDIFNFYRTTNISLLDGDVIDVATTNEKVSILRSALGYGDRLLLLSDQTQFVCWGDPILTPDLVTISPMSTYETLGGCPPISSGDSVFFAFNRGSFSGVREWFATGQSANDYSSTDVTTHVPSYIPGNITQMACASHENILVCASDESRDELYTLYFYGEGTQRSQQAWGKWKLGGGAVIHEMVFIGSVLYLVVERPAVGGGTATLHLESMDLQSGLKDTGSSYVTTLDRRLSQAGVTSKTYDAPTDMTTITLPYNISSGVTMVVIGTDGESANIKQQTAGTAIVKVVGDWSSRNFWVGEKYTMSYTFSKPLFKPTSGNQRSFVAQGRHQLRYAQLTFNETVSFNVTVTPEFGDSYSYRYTGKILNSGSATLGAFELNDGEFRFPVFSQSDSVTITVDNDSPLPCNLLTAEFEANYSTRSRRMN